MALYENVCFYDLLKNTATEKGYIFVAGAGQWTNIEHVTNNPADIYLIYEEDSSYFVDTGHGIIGGYKTLGQFYLVKHDTIDTDYETKRDTIISPMISLLEAFYEDVFGKCAHGINVESAKILELVNYLDCNFTGVGIDFVVQWMR